MYAFICHHLRDIRNRNVHDLNRDLENGERSNVNMPIERAYIGFQYKAIVVFALSLTIYEIFAYKKF